MSKVLCIKKEDYLKHSESKEPVGSYTVSFVERDIAESVESGWLQYIPYVSLYVNDYDSGKLAIVNYKRPSKGEGETRLEGKTSTGFGGHIEIQDYVDFFKLGKKDEEKITDAPEGEFSITAEELVGIFYTCCNRELKEEIGFSCIELQTSLENHSPVNFAVRMIEDEEDISDVNKVHLCCQTSVAISSEMLDKVVENRNNNEKEVSEIKVLNLNTASIVETFSVPTMVDHLLRELKTKENFEGWSVVSVNDIVYKVIYNVTQHVGYKDILGS